MKKKKIKNLNNYITNNKLLMTYSFPFYMNAPFSFTLSDTIICFNLTQTLPLSYLNISLVPMVHPSQFLFIAFNDNYF